MKIATPSEFFEAPEKEIEDRNIELEVRKGMMYSGKYSKVFPNCCSSRMWIKQGLYDYLSWLLCYERWSAISYLLNGYYPSDELGNCWRKILFIAFHDVVPGTGMDQAYDEVKQYLNFLKTELSSRSSYIFSLITEKESEEDGVERGDLIVFNSLSWEVRNWVELDLQFERGKLKAIKGLKSGDVYRVYGP